MILSKLNGIAARIAIAIVLAIIFGLVMAFGLSVGLNSYAPGRIARLLLPTPTSCSPPSHTRISRCCPEKLP